MNFVAIDVETANQSWGSICQVGLARYTNGTLVDTWSSLVDPKENFAARNVEMHKITPAKVAGAPTFRSLAPTISAWLQNQNVVSHSAFDRVAVRRAFAAAGAEAPACNWLDVARVSKRVWPGRGALAPCVSVVAAST